MVLLYALFSNLEFKPRCKYLCFDKWVCFSWRATRVPKGMELGHLILIPDNINNDNGNEPFLTQGLPANFLSHPSRALWDGCGGQEESKPGPCEEIGPLRWMCATQCASPSHRVPLMESFRCPDERPIFGPTPLMGELKLREVKSPAPCHAAEGRAKTKPRPIPPPPRLGPCTVCACSPPAQRPHTPAVPRH